MSDQMPEGYGQGHSVPDNVNNDYSPVGNEIETGNEGTATNDSQESSGTGYNPNWDEALNGLPPEFHEKLKPVFSKWDSSANQRYEKVQQEYAPYKILAENQVSIDDVRAAFELRNEITSNPQEMFSRLAQHLGIDLSRLNGNENLDGDESQGLSEYPDDEDPRYTELKRQNEAVINYLAQQEAQREQIQQAEQQRVQEETWYNSTKAELDNLEKTYGTLDRNRAVQFALWEAERTGAEFNLEAGVKAMNEFRSNAIQTSANANAANVFSGNGSLASGRVDTSKMSEAEFQEYAIAKIRAKNGG